MKLSVSFNYLLTYFYLDNTILLQPLVALTQYGNARNKPEFAERLAGTES